MKIVDIAVKKVYRFNCPNCRSRLEAVSQGVVVIGGRGMYIPLSCMSRGAVYRLVRHEKENCV